ncbi:MAG: hypothetical protein WCD07_04965 [Burkholderiales bacterium]
MRIAAIVCLFVAAIIFYAVGSAPGAGAIFVLGIVFETLGWLKVFNHKKASNDQP